MSALQVQLENLRTPAPVLARKRHFPIGTTVHRKGAMLPQGWIKARHLIHRENAEAFVAQAWPAEGESVHAVVPGDFIAGDIIPAVIKAHGSPASLWVTTLSLSTGSVDMLREVLRVCPVNLAVSLYFKSTSEDIFRALETLKSIEGFSLLVARIHTKIILFDYPLPVVVESSANLRSSNSIEQIAVHQSAPLFFFHRDWLTRLWQLAQEGHEIAKLP